MVRQSGLYYGGGRFCRGYGKSLAFSYAGRRKRRGAFVLIYLICILLVGIPMIIAEVTIGRAGERMPLEAIRL